MHAGFLRELGSWYVTGPDLYLPIVVVYPAGGFARYRVEARRVGCASAYGCFYRDRLASRAWSIRDFLHPRPFSTLNGRSG